MKPVVFRQLLVFGQGLYALESSGWAIGHCDRYRVIQGNHGVVRALQQQLIQRLDLRPVGFLRARGLVVDRRDRRLQLKGPLRPRGSAAVINAMPSVM